MFPDVVVAEAPALVAEPPHLAAVRATAAPDIDGKLDDAIWRTAVGTTVFTQKYPDEGAEPSERTTVRILYDDDALYIAFDCEQARAPVVEHLSRRDRLVEADRVEIDIGTRHDHKSAFQFTVNAGGVLTDSVLFNDTDSSSDWDENWEGRVARTRSGWSAELKIPLRILRFPSATVQSWDLQARRYISARQEIDEWAFIPRHTAGEVSHYGSLDDLRDLRASAPLEIRPFVLGRFRRRDAATTQLANGTDWSGSAGFDAKLHPSQSLTLDATINPDFAQVEADQQVLNLTTYETYYPEKRPFFLEGIDTFSTPRQLLYTRRIGRAAPPPTLRTDPAFAEQLVDVPEPARIYGASKLTGQLAPRWTIATLQAVTSRNDVEVQLPSGERQQRLIDPLSAFNVVRVKRDVGANGHIGVMATMATHAEQTRDYPGATTLDGAVPPATQLCPNTDARAAILVRPGSRCFDDAYVGALDWRWRSPTGAWVTGGQLTGTTLANGPDRAVRDGNVIHPGDLGTGAYAYINKEGGEHWVGDMGLEYEGRKLDYNDLGFNERGNDFRWRFDGEWRDLKPWRSMLERHARVEYFGRTNIDGLLIGSGYQLNVSGTFRNFWNVFTEVHWRPAYYDDREVGDGTALQRGGLLGYELELSSNPAKPVSFQVQTQAQAVSDGVILNGSAGLLFRALPQLDLEVLPTGVYTAGEPRYTGLQATGQDIFGRLRAESFGTTVRVTYTFAPRLTLQTYAQLFLAARHYTDFTSFAMQPGARARIPLEALRPFAGVLQENPDTVEGLLNANVVLRWEYALGSTLFVVYTRSQVPSVTLLPGETGSIGFLPVSRAPAADVILVKLSYFWAT
jgi:hypothetical protein